MKKASNREITRPPSHTDKIHVPSGWGTLSVRLFQYRGSKRVGITIVASIFIYKGIYMLTMICFVLLALELLSTIFQSYHGGQQSHYTILRQVALRAYQYLVNAYFHQELTTAILESAVRRK